MSTKNKMKLIILELKEDQQGMATLLSLAKLELVF